ncbi:MAG: hypothetical protein AAF634_05780 [Bacteroidota bacterium]
MAKKETSYRGAVPPVPHVKIDLRLDALKAGEYTLRLWDKNTIIKTVHFKK